MSRLIVKVGDFFTENIFMKDLLTDKKPKTNLSTAPLFSSTINF